MLPGPQPSGRPLNTAGEPPTDEMGDLDLSDVVDVPAIQGLMDDFYKLAHIPMSLIDLKGRVLVGVGWQNICMKFHRAHAVTCAHCLESDTVLAADIPPGEFRLYRCKNSMWDMATPIMMGGRRMGLLFSGQFFFEGEQVDREFFRRQAHQYGFDESQYLAALDAVPRLSRQAVDTGTAFFLKLADMLSRLGYSNIRLARALAARDAINEDLKRTTDELRRSNRDLEQFAYVSSHDLQEPLRMVTGFVQLLAKNYRGKLDASADQYIHYAVDGAKRMQQLIDDLLAYSRVGTKSRPMEMVDSGQSLQQAISNLSVAIEECSASVTSGTLPTVRADGTQLTQVFQNLIANAIKFIDGRKPLVYIDAVCEEGLWHFRVKDNGIGMSPEFHQKVFMIFQRLHTKDKYPGTGIGLAICKKIIDRHGGTMWVESALGEGSTFHFTIPA